MGNMCANVYQTGFLCLTLYQGEVCTDGDDDTNDANNDGQSMIVKRLFKNVTLNDTKRY